MKLGDAEKLLQKKLIALYDAGEAGSLALLTLEACTGLLPSALLLRKEELLSTIQMDQLQQYLRRLLQGEPIQYIMNKAFFYGMELYVNDAVLIPRPETEELVHWIIEDMKVTNKNVFEKKWTDADVTTQLKILDIGTGSGCIALALKKTMPRAEVWGCDVSDEALNVARRNGSALDIRVDFQGIDFLDEAQQKALPTVDIMVSNPPYIPLNDKETMHKNVAAYEPHTALFVPDNDPLLFYRAIAGFGKRRLHSNGAVYLEIHESLGHEVVELFKKEGYQKLELRKDMQGKERMVKVHL